ncbi:hypothetical protein [uncultured Endozoicomonas sp.]|uniref:hypothetical protein n=1 Tax=uncultured Endozoicomonas sp. TaxID=432652 RepID=UPI00261CE306|nr:hypothetical protein [uncultured Endozoicomonas sp.]
MSTNGESARKWLEENKGKIQEPRILQIKDNLLKKLQQSEEQETDTSEEYEGLLEALEVMESWLIENTVPEVVQNDLPPLDASPLVQDAAGEAPILSKEEKQQRFQALLESSKG